MKIFVLKLTKTLPEIIIETSQKKVVAKNATAFFLFPIEKTKHADFGLPNSRGGRDYGKRNRCFKKLY